MRRLLPLLLIVLPVAAHADSRLPEAPLANTQLADPQKEAAARRLMENVRCLVCDGQSVADSDAEMAGDVRALIRQKINAGETPESVKSWLIERYGKGITYAPPFDGETMILWLSPILLLVVGAIAVRGRIKRRRA